MTALDWLVFLAFVFVAELGLTITRRSLRGWYPQDGSRYVWIVWTPADDGAGWDVHSVWATKVLANRMRYRLDGRVSIHFVGERREFDTATFRGES